MNKLIGASWKMNMTPTEATAWFAVAVPELVSITDRELFVLPPFPALAAARDALRATSIGWGAQDVHPDESGAHTGDVSAAMLADLGCHYVEIGHSERRRDHREGSELLAAKVAATRRWRMTPILCVGERRRGSIEEATPTIVRQLRGALGALPPAELDEVVVAYEPVWAIGVGAAVAPADHIAAAHRLIRRWLEGRLATRVSVIYGGSVDPSNAASILCLPGVDGLFVGRAALDPRAFVQIAGTKCIEEEG